MALRDRQPAACHLEPFCSRLRSHGRNNICAGGLAMKLKLGRVVLGGIVGTLAITFLMYVGGPMMGLPRMDVAAMLGGMLGNWGMGMIMHILNGVIIFPAIYA